MRVIMKKKKGFTLIEMLVVVLIIGILAGVALPQYENAVWKTRFAEVYTVTNAIEKSLSLYVLQNGYPSRAISLTKDDLDIELPDSITERQNHGVSYLCSKYTCYLIECYPDRCQWVGYMYRDASNPSYQTQFTEMFGYLHSSDQSWGAKANSWYRVCWWEDGIPTEKIGKMLCMSTNWDDVGSGF